MRIVKIQTGPDGVSTQRELEPEYRDYKPETRRDTQRAMLVEPRVMLRRWRRGVVVDWHTAPEERSILILQGTIEIHTGDGQTMRYHPGDLLLAEDVDGDGHRTRFGDDEDCIALVFLHGVFGNR